MSKFYYKEISKIKLLRREPIKINFQWRKSYFFCVSNRESTRASKNTGLMRANKYFCVLCTGETTIQAHLVVQVSLSNYIMNYHYAILATSPHTG